MNQMLQGHLIGDPIRLGRTFREAAESFVEHGGNSRYLPKVIDYFDGKLLSEICPFDIREMALALYPDHENSTRNRCAITPVRSVIYHGYDRGWCDLMRIKSFKVERKQMRSPASHMWAHLFVRQCDLDGLPHLAACVLFMAQTGARVSEAVNLRWAQVDLRDRRALLLRTKTGANSERFLTDELIARLYKLQDGVDAGDHVFRYTTRWSVNDRILAVCRRAGISYKPSHTCGRKAFATNAIAMGIDVRTAMDAGDWKSADLFLRTYVFTQNAGRRVAEQFNSRAYDSSI